ncbi:MAG: PilW family protein [Desulfovibrionaceae bacterium]|nr:PilW family protein [Desulfovibrionaceae bacterium]
MPTTSITLPARAASRARQKIAAPWRVQRGVTLIELMVGLALGLIVVAVAVAALLVSHGISGTVSDVTGIQQQSAYALRLLGGQLRQAASLRLIASTTAVATDPMTPVAFIIKDGSNPAAPYYLDTTTSTGQAVLLSGTDGAGTAPDTLTVGFARDQLSVFVPPSTYNPATIAVNCVGAPLDTPANAAIAAVQSVFSVDSTKAELQCSGNGQPVQPVIQNVANFKVRYLVQDTATTPGTPQIQYFNATQVPSQPRGWASVQGIEVCLVLYGNEAIDMPAGSKYTDCDGSPVDMTTLTDSARRNHIHLVFRNVFQLRSMGVM